MTNLLPPEIKDEIKREYRLRFMAVCLAFVIFTMALGLIVSLPYAFSAHFARIETEQKTQKLDQLSQGTTTKETSSEFELFTKQLDLLKTSAKQTASTTTNLIMAVTSVKSNDISLNGFSFTVDAKGKRNMTVSGFASNRGSLQSFANELAKNSVFSAVDLPVSDFSKKTNIDFSISINISN